MRLTRLFVDAEMESGRVIDIPKETAAHLVKVLRARCGDELALFNGDGREFAAVIESIHGQRVTIAIAAARHPDTESPLHITLVQSLSRGEKMDFVVQKATEMGIARIVPVASSRSVMRLDGIQAIAKQKHWLAVATSACEQCGRVRLPMVDRPAPLLTYLGDLPEGGSGRWVLEPQSVAVSPMHPDTVRPSATQIAVGPEGGFTQEELDVFRLTGFSCMSLGPRVLRTETAAIAAVARLQTLFGDMA